ncbi:hypothetical protein A1O3_09886 [Capronia epimyces CBS 606.96]|uniref:Major facilitator superfamily (MFS) profile domain-containing protein n=1 Tax=Capronia epimyces CBS 606.96 TaxID=1182542 RepID=W9XAY5_9EURO|nr:uncharacterized protein A1O3_09886 [Capronia epimyces CBS 606.96]EXJ77657.1 hypothetical protein A1O3_09886 [Capronia epimyces CBS 606.96]
MAEPLTQKTLAEGAPQNDQGSDHDPNQVSATGQGQAQQETATHNDQPYTVFREREKIAIILTASFLALASPLSSAAYFPAINTLSADLHVSVSVMNLTVTAYQIFQGLAPSFIGTFSDTKGRRPAYLACFIIYLAANCGLATQKSYAALFVLRCLQASGSSGTIALASAAVADVSTRAERGKYLGYASMGVTLGPALGPVIGGAIDQALGWRWIFWFLAIYGGFLLLVVILLFPETCRSVVGNASVPPQRWNRTVYQMYRVARDKNGSHAGEERERWNGHEINRGSIMPPRWRPRPWNVFRIALQKEASIILVYGGLIYAGYMMVLSTLTSELHKRYGLDSLHIGLCYLPIGVGSLTSRWTVGTLLDRNFKRHARQQGMAIVANRQQNIDNFNVERARLQITLPFLMGSALFLIAYGWVMNFKTSIAAPEVLLFFVGHFTTGTNTSLNTLIVDTNRESPATATASSNLFRCLLGAGSVAVGTPLIQRIGIGWTGTFVAGVYLIGSPALLLLYMYGMGWRKELKDRERRKEEAKVKC